MDYFAAVYLDHHDEAGEAAKQVARATIAVLKAAGTDVRLVWVVEADTGSDSPGVVISTAELSEEDASELWEAYPYDEEKLAEWKDRGWEPAESDA